MLICEELLLLLTRDDGKVEGMSTQRDYGLAAGVVIDLLLAGLVDLSDDKDPRVTVTGTAPGDPVLDAALERLTEKDGKKFSTLVTDRKLNPEPEIVAKLAAAGVIDVQEKQLLGLVPARYPVLDPAPEDAVRERLRQALASGEASAPDATILSVLQGLGVAKRVLAEEAPGLSSRELKQRIQQVSVSSEAGAAVKRAVDAANALLVSTVMMTTVAAASTATN